MMREINDTPHVLYSTAETVSQMADAAIPLCINFAMGFLCIALEKTQIGRYSCVETVVIVTNLHIASGKHMLCTAHM